MNFLSIDNLKAPDEKDIGGGSLLMQVEAGGSLLKPRLSPDARDC
jgi:hypothetical protein